MGKNLRRENGRTHLVLCVIQERREAVIDKEGDSSEPSDKCSDIVGECVDDG